MRRILLLTMMTILALTASAYDFMVDGIAYNYLNGSNGNEVGVAYGSGSNINIPSQVTYNGKTYTVTRICNQAFCERNITSITIPSSITSIGNMAFSDCGVGAVYITDIAKWCEITFEGFRLSEAMGDIEEISNPLYQAHHLYLNGVEVKDLVIPNTVTRITSYAFLGCSSFTSVTIPSSVTSIGYGAFGLCDNIQSVHISDLAKWCEINFVDPYFDDWYGHGFSVLYSNPLRVAHHLYMNGEEIKNLIIPNTVTKINDYAFEGASSITSVTIPNSVKYLGDKSLSCSGLTEINSKIQDVSTVDTWDESYGRTKDVFESVPKTTCVLKVPAGTANSYRQTAPWSDFTNIVEVADELDDEFIVNGIAYKKNDNGNTVSVISNIVNNVNYPNLTVVTIPDAITVTGTTYQVTSIDRSAFSGCTSLTSVTIPATATYIGPNAFSGCQNLKDIRCKVTNINSVSVGSNAFNGVPSSCRLFIPNGTTSAYSAASSWNSFTKVYEFRNDNIDFIYNGFAYHYINGVTGNDVEVTFINSKSEYVNNYSHLTSVTLPTAVTNNGRSYSVTALGQFAFDGSSTITSASMPVTLTTIGNRAFYNCSKLASIMIPKSVNSISTSVFARCPSLASISVSTANTTFDSRNNCNAIIEKATNKLVAGCKSTVIPNTVTSIGRGAFSGATGLTSIIIPNSVTVIDEWAFQSCSGLTRFELPASVTTLGKAAFGSCSSLTEFKSNATNVDNVTMGETVFVSVPTTTCVLLVPVGTAASYRQADQWSDFANITEYLVSKRQGDLNGDNVVNGSDVNIMVNLLIGSASYADPDNVSDINGDSRRTGADLNKMISIILGQ